MTTRSAAAAAEAPKRAYATLLAGDGDRWKGVVELAKCLRDVESAYPLVVAVLPDVPEAHRRILKSQRGLGIVVRDVEPVHPPEIVNVESTFAMEHYVAYYSKLRIWELVEYERMVYLDAGARVLEKIDELFEANGHLLYPPSGKRHTDVFVLEPSMATAEAMLHELSRSATPATDFFEKHNVAYQQRHLLRAGSSAGGMGGSGSLWMAMVGLFITGIAVGAAAGNFLFKASPCSGESGALNTALSFSLFLLALAGVILINAGICLTERGIGIPEATAIITRTARRVVSKVAAFARRNVAVLGVAGASSALTGVILFAPGLVLHFVCFALFPGRLRFGLAA